LGVIEKESIGYKHVLVVTVVLFLISFWLHYPGLVPTNYSDVVSIWYRDGVRDGLVPYVDYDLEYPALTGLAVYVSSLGQDLNAYYHTMNLIVFALILLSTYVLYKILKMSNQPLHKINYYVIFTPAFIFFTIYSFDWIGVSFLLFSMYFSLTKKAHLSGLFMGLAVAARIIPIVCLPFILREFKTWRERIILLATAAAAWIVPNAYFMIVDFKGFLYPYTFQGQWGVEDSWFIVFGQFFDGRQNLSLILLISVLALIFVYHKRFNVKEASLLALLGFVLTSFKFPPQYMILLLPFFAINRVNYTLFMAANMLNLLIILWWFTPLFNLGNALLLSSPVQWVAIARQLILIPIFISFFRSRNHLESTNHDEKSYHSSPIR
jgi:hypothetical protein